MTEQEELELLKQKSPYALPDNPSQSGWSTDQIKRKFFEGLFFLYDLFKQQRTNIAADVEAMQAIVDLINEEYQDIISGNPIKAKYDDENNEIKITYAKVLSLVDGTLGVLKYLKRNNSTGYIYTLEEDLEIVKSDLTKIFNGTKVVDRSYSDQNGNNISNTYVKKTDIVNDFTSHAIDKPLSANKGRELKSLIETLFDYVGYADATDENTVIDKLREVFAFLTNVDDSQTLIDLVDGKIALVANGTNINTFAEAEAALALKANSSNVYDKTETYTKTEIDNKDTSNLQQAKSYTDSKIEDLKWELGTYDLGVDTINGTTMLLSSPANTIQATMVRIDGASEKSENLIVNQFTPNLSAGSEQWINFTLTNLIVGETYTIANFGTLQSNEAYQLLPEYSNFASIPKTFTATASTKTFRIGANNLSANISYTTKIMLVKGSTAPTEFKVGFANIHNLKLSGLKVEGFNIWDEQWELGSIDSTTGETTTNFNTIKSKNYIPVYPNVSYYKYVGCTEKNLVFTFYDNNYNIVPYVKVNSGDADVYNNSADSTNSKPTFVVPSGAYYMKFRTTQGGYGTTYNNDICINISGSANGTYVPYITPTTTAIDLTSIEDSGGNKLFADGSIKGVGTAKDYITPYKAYKQMGSYTFTGNETITKTSAVSGGGYRFNVAIPFTITLDSAFICDTLKEETPASMYAPTRASKGIAIRSTTEVYIYIEELVEGTTTDMKNWLINNPTTIVIQLATPIEADIDLSQLVKFEAHSNGSITLVNTNNQDTTSTFKYLKEVAK